MFFMEMSREYLFGKFSHVPLLAKGDKGGFLKQMFYDKKELMCIIHKISPYPSLLKRGIREKLILNI
jgi:hypothetical protein